jgi:gamma-glutamylcyclotransferase (GGCT)/AIG2-like uncharacterized protein YtfP
MSAHFLFAYGTLQQEEVQWDMFGRLLDGQRDALVGFESSLVKIEDGQLAAAAGRTHHANVTFTGRPESLVKGMVFAITEVELAAADEYEKRAGYQRIPVTLASGKKAWAYVHRVA